MFTESKINPKHNYNIFAFELLKFNLGFESCISLSLEEHQEDEETGIKTTHNSGAPETELLKRLSLYLSTTLRALTHTLERFTLFEKVRLMGSLSPLDEY